jgi:hypothetical protein
MKSIIVFMANHVFIDFGFVFPPASRSRGDETGFRAIRLGALQRRMHDSLSPADSKEYVAWCETWCLDGEKI